MNLFFHVVCICYHLDISYIIVLHNIVFYFFTYLLKNVSLIFFRFLPVPILKIDHVYEIFFRPIPIFSGIPKKLRIPIPIPTLGDRKRFSEDATKARVI